MLTVTSRDGTPIAYFRSGSGPPLLLVHGATADHTTTWRSVRSELEQRFTVFALDRRGRGRSGDSAGYDLGREAEDVAAVVAAIGAPVSALGHSHGALCVLEAALLSAGIERMVLYEGVPVRGAGEFAPGAVDRLESLLAAGDFEGVLESLLRDIVEMPDDQIALMRAQHDAWQTRLGNVRTTPRELRAYERYVFDAERFGALQTPTLLLVGGESPEREHQNAARIAAALCDARVAILPGQQHVAMHTAPDAFLREVCGFLGR